MKTGLALGALLMVAAPGVVHAEWPFDDLQPRKPPSSLEVGPRGGYDWDGDTFSGGAQARIPVWRRTRVALVPSGDVFNDGTGADWQANLDILLSPGPRGGFYGGLGFGWVELAGGERERAVNQVLGLRLPLGHGRYRSYVEARWTELDAATAFRIVFGFNMVLLRY